MFERLFGGHDDGGDDGLPHGVAGREHVDVTRDEAFGLGLTVDADERLSDVDELHPRLGGALLGEQFVRLTEFGDLEEALAGAGHDAEHVEARLRQGGVQLAGELPEIRQDSLRLGASVDVVAAFVKDHRARLERDGEVFDEMIGGLVHPATADTVVMDSQRRQVGLHALPELHVRAAEADDASGCRRSLLGASQDLLIQGHDLRGRGLVRQDLVGRKDDGCRQEKRAKQTQGHTAYLASFGFFVFFFLSSLLPLRPVPSPTSSL